MSQSRRSLISVKIHGCRKVSTRGEERRNAATYLDQRTTRNHDAVHARCLHVLVVRAVVVRIAVPKNRDGLKALVGCRLA